MATLDISVDSAGAMRMLGRVEGAVGGGIVDLFQRLGPTLRNELRPRIPKKTGRARAAIFFRIEASQRDTIDLLVGGDLIQAPHLLYIEKPRVGGGPIETFQRTNQERIVRAVEDSVGDAVRRAGGND